MSEDKKQRIKNIRKSVVKLIKAESFNLIKNR